jgi:hypothetical protein
MSNPTENQLQEYRKWRKEAHERFKKEYAGYSLACESFGWKEQIDNPDEEKIHCVIHFSIHPSTP